MSTVQITFVGGADGDWQVTASETLRGDKLADVAAVTMQVGGVPPVPHPSWALVGVLSNLRYTTGREVADLRRIQAPLARPEALCAALIPIRKSQAWWDLPQDERRAIYEERSHHTSIGMEYLPQIARRLHHSRDIGEPFDFLTWFEFAHEHAGVFDELLARLRATEEWSYVDREIEIRLRR